MCYFALRKEDERVLLVFILNPSSPDLIVKEIRHHKVCYSRYTRTLMIGSNFSAGANVSKESHGSSGLAYTWAFSWQANEIKQ